MRRPLRSDEARAVANLAIDLGDPGRMAKARRLHRSDSVGTVDIEGGVAQAIVADRDGDSHEVSVSVVAPPAGQKLPAASDIVAECDCDDTSDACQHALATILCIAEQVEADPRTIDRWTGAEAPPAVAAYVSPSGDAQSFFTGEWTPDPPAVKVTRLRPPTPPHLLVDGVDAGPVIVDALDAIAKGLDQVRG